MRLKRGVRRAILVVLIIILICCCAFVLKNAFTKKEVIPEVTVESHIDDYGYVLNSNETDLYKKYFKELESVLNEEEVEEEKYVSLLTKLFIADFYNLDNKLTKKDIGGAQFVHSSIRDNFQLKAENKLYQYIESNIYNDRNQELPIVKEVESTEIEIDSYKYDDTVDKNAYFVTATWSYEKDLGYETTKVFIFVHEDNKLSLVEMEEVSS